MKLRVEDFVPEKYEVDCPKKDFIKVHQDYRKGRGNKPIPIILPEYIEIDEDFIAGCAMYLGDGKIKDIMHLDFVSKDNDIVKFMLKFFINYFQWSKGKIMYTLTYKDYREGMAGEWKRYLGLQGYSIRIRKSKRHKK